MKKILLLFGLIGVLFTSCSNEDSTLNDKSCDCRSKIIAENDFNTFETSNYTILDVHINENCLDITISSSGCDPKSWGMDLVSTDAFYSVDPLEKGVKIKLTNDQTCLTVFKKTKSFDLTPFQIEGQNRLLLNIEGWHTQIIYRY